MKDWISDNIYDVSDKCNNLEAIFMAKMLNLYNF
jgi:hypothetical protein